jgi:hypothetical protein
MKNISIEKQTDMVNAMKQAVMDNHKLPPMAAMGMVKVALKNVTEVDNSSEEKAREDLDAKLGANVRGYYSQWNKEMLDGLVKTLVDAALPFVK